MVFQSDTYSVLLVSASEKLNTAMAELLPPTDFFPVTVAAADSRINPVRLPDAAWSTASQNIVFNVRSIHVRSMQI